MDRRQLLFGASALGLVTNLNLNHPLIAQVGTAVMGNRRLSDRERAGLRGPVKTCSDLRGRKIGLNTDYSPDGRLLGYRVCGAFPGLGMSDIVDVTTEFYDMLSNKTKVCRISIGVTDEFQYDEQGRKTRVRKVSPSSILSGYWAAFEMTFEVAEAGGSLSGGGTVTTRYNENDQPIESLVRNSGGELVMKINHDYTNGRLINEILVIVNAFEFTRQMRPRFSENDNEEARAFLDQLQGLRVERSYTYDADDRVIRRLTQAGNSKEDESKTYNAYGDEDWTLMIRSGIDYDERSEFRYLYQYDSHGNWTERTTINTDQPGNPNTQRRTLSYYGFPLPEISSIRHPRRRLMATRRKLIQVTSAAGAAPFIRGEVAASAEEREEDEVKKLPMMPIRDMVIFPYMMTPFVVGRESSVQALEEALAADKKIFLATQHDASIDEPKPNEIYQVGTVVNILQSLKLPDGNIKVRVEGIERGKILQVTETEGFMQVTVSLPGYASESTPEIETAKQQVKSLFEQYVKLGGWEMIPAVRMEEDPAKLTDTIAANLQLSVEEKQGLLEIFDPAGRLNRIGVLLELEIKKLNQYPQGDV